MRKFITQFDGLADATAQRLKTYKPVVTLGANHAMQKLMSAVVTCHKWEAPAARPACKNMESDMERLRLDFLTYHMLSVEFFTVVAKSQVRRHVTMSPEPRTCHVAMSPEPAMSPCRPNLSCRHVAASICHVARQVAPCRHVARHVARRVARQVAPCRHVARHVARMSSCRPVMSSCRPHVAMSPACRHVALSCRLVMSPCRPVMWPCRPHVTMSPACRHVALTQLPCRHDSRMQRQRDNPALFSTPDDSHNNEHHNDSHNRIMKSSTRRIFLQRHHHTKCTSHRTPTNRV